MEAACTSNLQYCSWIAPQKIRQKPSGCLELPQRWGEDRKQQMLLSSRIMKGSADSKRHRLVGFEINRCYRNSEDSALEPGRTRTFVDEPKIVKKKAQEIAPYLTGRCIYLVGMMGSGKTTVGKILSEVLGYSFFDSDKLVEQAVGMTSVAQIFKEHSETFFRDNESEVLRELSLMHRLVVATGGGAVIRPINWKYMKHGITVWLDVPLEALATRIAAVGTDSRPLLHHESGDAYTKALARLSTLSQERGHAYTNADARVSLEHIASKLGHGDVCRLTPTDIATEALIQMKHFLLGTEEDDDE
ncbi:shikimate kinase 3, chloroplastic-like [Papaver somniferum]|uniref:shikimate kinase 3, chloroplastic-like n=1 Tax=Papaver somniferum TaxID=3469 RepID=UPI000E7037AD|nr:shikimate kinase 3, chloroplastic-like [Papaver somniferum]XP_026446891.1 shikimate kinase 3, chloroplastic-like [Papaver somniferum]